MTSDDEESFRTYAMDAEEALRDIEGSLLTLEKDPESASEVNRLYRALHTVKGNSALLGLLSIETLAHAAEDMVGMARERTVKVDAEMTELMLQLVDRLKAMVERAGRDHRDHADDAAAALVERIRGWTRARGGKKQVAVGATRGEILIWSELPAHADGSGATEQIAVRDASGAQLDGAVEFFLAQCREHLPRLFAELGGARDAGGESDLEGLGRLLGELTQPALRLGYFELVDALAILERLLSDPAASPSDLKPPLEQLARELILLEQRWLTLDDGNQDFGIARLCSEALGITVEPLQPLSDLIDSEPPAAAGVITDDEPALALSDASPAAPVPQPGAPQRPPSKAPGTATSSKSRGEAEFLRIDARKLSLVMDLAGEIALASGAVTHHPEIENLQLEGFSAAAHKLEVLIRELQSEVSAMRLVPVAGVFNRMQRMVRDTARRTGKQVALTLIGEDTEIDKVMVDSLHDPLVHVVRNAVDHGIELPEDRVAQGKSPVGSLILEASHQGGEVNVKVRDDGRGLDRARILARARERGLVDPKLTPTDEQLFELVFLPGFSTKQTVDELSGRGVGMDVLKTTIEGLRGRVHIESKEGRGSVVNMTVPLTLAFVEAMVVRSRERLFALPIEKVSEVFKVDDTQLSRNSADEQTTLRVRDRLIPLLWLHRFYGDRGHDDEQVVGKVVVVVQNSRGSVALPVDALLGNQPVMLKPMRGPLANVRAAAGCGMLRSGDVALALDCERLPV